MDHPWFLVMVVSSFAVFGAVLGFVSFEETRARRKAKANKLIQAQLAHREKLAGDALLAE